MFPGRDAVNDYIILIVAKTEQLKESVK